MTDTEKKICEDVLRDGEVTRHVEFESEGKQIEQWTVEYFGEEYHMTKHNGEWVYFHHTIR